MTSAESLVRMTAQQMASDELKKLREKTVTEHLDEHVVIQEGALGVGVSIKSLHDYGDNKINTKSLESGNATFNAPKHLAESNAAKEAEADEVKSSRKRKNSKAISDSEANDDDDININGQRKAKKKRRSFLPELPKLQSFTSPAAAPVSSVGSAGTDITRGDELFSDDEEDETDKEDQSTFYGTASPSQADIPFGNNGTTKILSLNEHIQKGGPKINEEPVIYSPGIVSGSPAMTISLLLVGQHSNRRESLPCLNLMFPHLHLV